MYIFDFLHPLKLEYFSLILDIVGTWVRRRTYVYKNIIIILIIICLYLHVHINAQSIQAVRVVSQMSRHARHAACTEGLKGLRPNPSSNPRPSVLG